MDQEYLQNMMGSPYVNEGAFGQLKAKAAQAMGAAGTMAGHQIQNPNETKLRSLWDGFLSSLKKAMKDWESQVAPMFDEQVPLNEKQQQVKDSMDELARLLSSVGPQKIGTASDDFTAPGVRTQRRNPNTFVKGSVYNRSTTSPKSSKLTELIDEGFWDAAKRDVGLNKSLGSNDPSTILDSYKNHILSLFRNFMKDAVKSTKMTAQQIYSMLAKMQPAQQGWQAAGNMQKVVQQLTTLQSIGDIKGVGAPPQIPGAGTPPAISQQSPKTVHPSPAPTQKPPAVPVSQPVGQAPSGITTPPAGGSSGGVAGGSGEIPPQDLPFIILKAIKIAIDTVQSDAGHAGKYFSVSELPKDFGGPSLTKEIVAGPKPKSGNTGEEDAEETPEVPGEFLYNFHSKYRKTPQASFSIQMKPVHESPKIEGTPYEVEVFWQNESHKNKIWAVAENQGKKSKPILLMQFFDNEVNSKSGATTPGDVNFFSIEKVLQAATPNANPLDPDPKNRGLLSSATNETKAEIKKLEPLFLRALMATTGRKVMEWKAKSKKVFPITYNEKGDVTYTDKNGNPKELKKAEINDLLNNSDYVTSEKWTETLDHYDYFNGPNASMKPKDPSESPAFQEVVTKMMQAGADEPTAKKLVATAWMTITQDKPKDKITAEELIFLASGKGKIYFDFEMAKYTELDAALKALIGPLGFKEKEILPPLQKAWKILKTSQEPEAITAEELVKLVQKKSPTTAPAPASTPPVAPATSTTPSKPAGQPAPASSVSTTASGPQPSGEPIAPVSTDQPTPDQGKQPSQPAKSTKKSVTQPIEIWKGENGQMQWKNKAGKIGGLTSKGVSKFKNDPGFQQALKTAKEKGFKSPYTDLKERVINPFQRDNFL